MAKITAKESNNPTRSIYDAPSKPEKKVNLTTTVIVAAVTMAIGVIIGISKGDQTITVEYDDSKRVRYSFSELDELELAYAVTIHKSQGSEYPAVIMPLLGGPRMLLNRNLLYTGVTRAKKCVTILGDRATISTMIHNISEKNRYTGLALRIREIE